MAEGKTFIEKTQPINILDVMSRDVLERLLDSYCFPLKTAITVYYSLKYPPKELSDITWVEIGGKEKQNLLNFPFCRRYRDFVWDEYERAWDRPYQRECKKHDSEIVMKYYKGNWEGPKLFHCYLGLWEMTYPVYAGGRLLGVFYGGQLIVTPEVVDWGRKLDEVENRKIRNEIVWKPFDGDGGNIPRPSNQVEEVERAIRDNTVIKLQHKKNLKEILQEEVRNKTFTADALLSFYGEFKKFGTVVERVLRDLYTAQAEHNLMKTSLKVLGHETVQLTFGLEELRKKYLLDANKLRELKEHKANDICRDIAGYFKQLNLLFSQAGMVVTDLPEPKKEDFWAYRELLFKWEDIYRLQAEHESLKFDIYHPYESDPLRPPVYGDKMLLEQLVYNLVSNAVKYCYQGTKIKLECCKLDTKKKNPHILTVTNYGREFICQNPWELGKRGDNVQGVEGIGIGLYNAKRVAEAHNASIEYDSQKVCDFNVPLIEAYTKQDFKGKDLKLVGRLEGELERLRQLGEYDKIVARSKFGLRMYQPVGDELVDLIMKPMWKVTFKVTIPAKGY